MTPEFRKFWLGRSVSFVGSEVTVVALPLAAVLLLDADAREMGWLVAAQNLPWIFFALAAGVWVDRVRRQPVLVVTNFGQAASLAVIPIAAAARYAHPCRHARRPEAARARRGAPASARRR